MADSCGLKQLTVFLENRKGRLADICGALGKAGVNILALSLADTADFGILRLIVNDPEKAADALREQGFTVTFNDVLALQVEDRPGGLARILRLLDDADVNVEYLYAFTGKEAEHATLAFRVEEPEEAVRALEHAGVVVVRPES